MYHSPPYNFLTNIAYSPPLSTTPLTSFLNGPFMVLAITFMTDPWQPFLKSNLIVSLTALS